MVIIKFTNMSLKIKRVQSLTKDQIHDLITFYLVKNKITKVKLAKVLNVSYPTILSKIDNTDTLKQSELRTIFSYLKISELLIKTD
mgnify:CR=1 FL=1